MRTLSISLANLLPLALIVALPVVLLSQAPTAESSLSELGVFVEVWEYLQSGLGTER